MGRGKAFDVFKRDSVLLEFMKKHKGEANIVSSKQISDYMNENGYSTSSAIVHSLIKRIMYERNAPICYTNTKGYYWASNRAEIQKTIADMESRQASLQEHIDHLKNFII